MSVLDIKKRRNGKTEPPAVGGLPADIRFARLTERAATLTSALRSQAADETWAAAHSDGSAGLEARIAKMEVAVAQLEAALS